MMMMMMMMMTQIVVVIHRLNTFLQREKGWVREGAEGGPTTGGRVAPLLRVSPATNAGGQRAPPLIQVAGRHVSKIFESISNFLRRKRKTTKRKTLNHCVCLLLFFLHFLKIHRGERKNLKRQYAHEEESFALEEKERRAFGMTTTTTTTLTRSKNNNTARGGGKKSSSSFWWLFARAWARASCRRPGKVLVV